LRCKHSLDFSERDRRVVHGGLRGVHFPFGRTAEVVAWQRPFFEAEMTPDEVARQIVAGGVAPACAAGCAKGGSSWAHEVGGDVDLFFDLASLTKPATALAVACAGIDRATPLGKLLPEARGTDSEHASLEHLLSHRAGLEGHRPLYLPLVRGERVDFSGALREAAGARRDDARGAVPTAGFPPLYSDLGYVLAGAALARHVGARDAGEAVAWLVVEPLGLADRIGTIRELAARGALRPCAPTEDVPWRGGHVTGAVHDENAWALTGLGGSGHAGLFGTVEGVLKFGECVLDAMAGRPGPLGAIDIEWLVKPRPGGTLRAGFDGKSPEGSSAGSLAGARTFGHLGFVGTSLWMDPDARSAVTLLTNRVFDGRDHLTIRVARPWAHDALWQRAQEISPVAP
jgi:CubicO group peptidase (beta-lactamase class C family)